MTTKLAGVSPNEGVLASLDTRTADGTATEAYRMDEAYDTVLVAALEGILEDASTSMAIATEGASDTKKTKALSKKIRDSLPDKAFGIPSERKYPLVVDGQPEVTRELLGKAIGMFHFCKPEWRKELAGNIVKTIEKLKLDIKIPERNQIHKYTSVPPEMTKPSAKK